MRTVGNILWLVLAGVWLAIGYVIAGIINCVLIITIPFGIQSFKLAGYALWPFGRMVVHRPDRDVALGCLGNAIWFVFGGVWLALGHLVAGLLLCVTVIGIPLGIASFKMAGLALAPFGKEIVPLGTASPSTPGTYEPPPRLG
ncbi:MAG: YccF domain-containing protein [Actinobacteria bacterium]|nr:YccF domain-containing protein [Actinomycetota bacterium]